MVIAIFIWGFAESTLFFIIPDVLLSLYAIQKNGFVRVILANFICVLGAIVGGTITYSLSAGGTDLINVLMNVPAIHPHMVEHVHEQLSSNVFVALITGPLFGVPYKIFASVAPEYTSLAIFLMVSIPARLARFLFISILSYMLSHYVFKQLSMTAKYCVWSAVWLIGYGIYFCIIGF
ncbi:hypothetical protein [Aliicoccus persicus]|nr:hypothetical protein [Aliicoccus persicus]